jgi:hypothetical protein
MTALAAYPKDHATMASVLERPRPFDLDVLADDGRVDARKLAAAIDVTLPQLAQILHVKAKNLSDSPTSRKIQDPAIKLVAMMNDVAEYVSEKPYAVYWLRVPRRELGDQSALDWLMRGKLDEIRDHVARVVDLQPD